MTSTVVTPSGLVVPASAVGDGQASPLTGQHKGSRNEAPVVPEGFARDLAEYGRSLCRKYRAKWNDRHEVFIIEAEDPSTGGWVEAIAVIDWDHFGATGGFKFRPLDRRVIEELYAADLFVKFNETDGELAATKEADLTRECQRLAAERFSVETEGMFKDIQSDAWTDHARIKQILDVGHAHGYRPLHQVHANTPTTG